MAGLGLVVQAPMLALCNARHDNSPYCGIARQCVSDHQPRGDALPLEQLTQPPLGSLRVATAANQEVEPGPSWSTARPPRLPASHADDNLVEMPLISRCRKTAADLIGTALAQLQSPLPNRLVADLDPSG
jgi:hypothetical protein